MFFLDCKYYLEQTFPHCEVVDNHTYPGIPVNEFAVQLTLPVIKKSDMLFELQNLFKTFLFMIKVVFLLGIHGKV